MSSFGLNSTGSTGRLLQQYRSNNELVGRSIERLSTGKRINRPSDDPAGFLAAEELRGDILDLQTESRIASSNRFRVRQRSSALSQIQSTLTNVRGSLVSAADGLNTEAQSRAIQQEIDASLDAIDLIASRVEGVRDSTPLKELREGGTANVIDGNVSAAQELVESKLQDLNLARAATGAYEKTEDTFERLRQDQIAITSEALSQIEDADYVEETVNLVKGQILSEASILALAYVNREQLELVEELFDTLDEDSSD